MKNQKIFNAIISAILILIVLCVGSIAFSNPTDVIASSNIINGCVYAGNTKSNKISLMINVYWGTEYIEPILSILEEKHAKCTFFVGGVWVKEYPDVLQKIYQNGHEIASHGYSHKEHEKLSYEQNLLEIQKCHNIVKQTIGIDMNLFAPPGGSYNSDTVKCAENLGYKTIMWTRDTIDWRDQDTNLIYNRAIKNMSSGDLILMHPKEKTVEALPQIIDYAISMGFSVTTVSDTIA